MEIDGSASTVRISVREFAEFSLTAKSRGNHHPWRAQLGTIWHQTLQKEEPQARAEVPIKASWMVRNWRVEFDGRMDQLLYDEELNTTLIREIKTTDLPLPLADEGIREHCDAYFRQLATYMVLLPVTPEHIGESSISGELVLVDIRSGLRQTIALDSNYRALFDQQLERLLNFVDSGQRRIIAFRSTDIRPPFDNWRLGQPEAIADLERHAVSHPFIFFEAPTGFGKTGILLHFALRQMQQNVFTHLIYLTGKSTGQIQAAAQLRRMLPGGGSLRFFQMRNRREHAIESPRHTCQLNGPCLEDDFRIASATDIDPDELYEQQKVSIADIRQIGARTGICPYEISRLLLAYAEIWLCDYNYVFAPGQQHILADQPGYSPETTLLIIDEAHNLPARVCDAYSFALSATAGGLVSAEFFSHDVPYKLEHAWRAWTAWLESVPRATHHPHTLLYDLTDQIDSLTKTFQTAIPVAAGLPQSLVNSIYHLYRIREMVTNFDMPQLLWSPESGTLQCQCLDASVPAGQTLSQFGKVILTSATLSPVTRLQAELGINRTDAATVEACCPWRDNAYRVAIDTRVDTRLRSRASHYSTTAETIIRMTATGQVPAAVFFPSYLYAETIRTYVKTLDPGLNISIQPRNADLAGQLEFLDETFLTAHALFFILGSGFSESIDHLGGRVGMAMVVGPALPEVNPIQDARMELYGSGGREAAFDRTYRQPAMTKINQALGRLVRAPGQSASVLLHCRRFAEPSYLNALAPEYRDTTTICSDDDLVQWLAGSRSPVR